MKVAESMEKLKPGSREILREVDMTKKDVWDIVTHDEVFSDSQRLKDLYTDLNADMWWILTVKTTGECAKKIQAVEAGMGLEAY